MLVLEHWLLTSQRIAIHVPTQTAVIADVHLGYHQARRKRGEAVPLLTVAEQLAPLPFVLAEQGIRKLIVAGDLFEESPCAALIEELLIWLEQNRLELTAVIPGNHDGPLAKTAPQLPVAVSGHALADWTIVHGDGPLPRGPVVHGHLHPCFRVGTISAPCYLVHKKRLVLPAFSQEAAGVNVLTEPAWTRHQVIVCAGEKLLDFGEARQMQRV